MRKGEEAKEPASDRAGDPEGLALAVRSCGWQRAQPEGCSAGLVALRANRLGAERPGGRGTVAMAQLIPKVPHVATFLGSFYPPLVLTAMGGCCQSLEEFLVCY